MILCGARRIGVRVNHNADKSPCERALRQLILDEGSTKDHVTFFHLYRPRTDAASYLRDDKCEQRAPGKKQRLSGSILPMELRAHPDSWWTVHESRASIG